MIFADLLVLVVLVLAQSTSLASPNAKLRSGHNHCQNFDQ